MVLIVVDAWGEHNTLVATICVKSGVGETVTFDIERPIKLWEMLLDKEALTGLHLQNWQ